MPVAEGCRLRRWCQYYVVQSNVFKCPYSNTPNDRLQAPYLSAFQKIEVDAESATRPVFNGVQEEALVSTIVSAVCKAGQMSGSSAMHASFGWLRYVWYVFQSWSVQGRPSKMRRRILRFASCMRSRTTWLGKQP